MEIVLKNRNLTFEQMIYSYIENNYNTISMSRLNEIVSKISNVYIQNKILDAENAINVAKERGLYLKTYLKGDMYITEDAAKRNLPAQIKNAEEILKYCKQIPTRY